MSFANQDVLYIGCGAKFVFLAGTATLREEGFIDDSTP